MHFQGLGGSICRVLDLKYLITAKDRISQTDVDLAVQVLAAALVKIIVTIMAAALASAVSAASAAPAAMEQIVKNIFKTTAIALFKMEAAAVAAKTTAVEGTVESSVSTKSTAESLKWITSTIRATGILPAASGTRGLVKGRKAELIVLFSLLRVT